MNKKLLLVSLLAVGMLVGCGGGNPPASSEPGSSEQGGEEQGNWTGKYGNAGYYLVGEMNGWADFWKFQGFESFEFTQSETDENIYTLTYSVTEEFLASADAAGDTADAVDYKVMYWDGNKAPTQWFPGGVNNNGVINEAGEYVLTFNVASSETAEKTDGSGETYTKYTSHERIGDANPETAYAKGEARQFEAAYAAITFRVVVDEELTIPTGKSVYIYTWSLKGEDEANYSGFFEMTNNSGIWTYTTAGEVLVDDGTGVGVDHGFCILVDEPGKTKEDWAYKVTNSASTDGNYSIHVTKTKHSGTEELKLEDKPYWLKGTVHAPYTVDEAYAIRTSDAYTQYMPMVVTGTVQSATYSSKYGNWEIYLEAPSNPSDASHVFLLYAAHLGENIPEPQAGDVICATGFADIYSGYKYQLSFTYIDNVKTHPVVYDLVRASEYYVKGTMNDWKAVELHRLVMTSATTAEITMAVSAEAEFKVANDDWSKEAAFADLTMDASAEGAFVDSGSGNIKCAKSGTYRFVLDLTDPANEKVTVYAA